ncbi:MAG: 4-methyl-5-nitrocatechol 5-monooxygenase [Chlamydiae bacterium]|nr:4-methyl-5-nitrocatechol 5-monooxygenase [Chlamydiota bacterium]
MYKVAIIGGGPVGLSAAICLACHGIQSLLIEKHPCTTKHPKARGVNARSMEVFRSWGLENQMKQHQLTQQTKNFTWITWLKDFQEEEIAQVKSKTDYSSFSPSTSSLIAQDDVEKELLKKAQSMPLIDLRFNTEMLHASQNDKHVTIEICNKENNHKEVISSQYLIAADGAKSSLRTMFNIEMEGVDNLAEFCNIYCEMDLNKYVKHRPSAAFMFTRPDILGSFMLSRKGFKKWLVGKRIDSSPSLSRELFTDSYCVEYIKKIVNDPNVEVRLINKAFWTMAALVAKQYRVGRIFLAGDAAHRLPPTGGFGMNTGLQDVHNLAWKLAMVLNNQAKDSLLDTYFDERSQVAKTNIQWSLKNSERFNTIYAALAQNELTTFKKAVEDQYHHVNNILLDLGVIYGNEYQNEERYKPSAKVGARAPHCWLVKSHDVKSTLDLYSNKFVLICHREAKHWQDKFSKFPCEIITIGEQGDYIDKNHDFLEKYEISKEGAVLVRPDGHVAWNSNTENMPNFSWLLSSKF